MSGESERPLLRVVRGTPDDVELAALTAVVAGLASAGNGVDKPARRSVWSYHGDRHRRPLRPGPNAWRASAWPR